jgi:hypothetical protein
MFKLIKSKDWTASNGNKGTSLTVAYKGRVFNANKSDFPNIKIDEKAGTVSFGEECEVVAEKYTTELGEVRQGLRIKPKMDLTLSAF